MQSDFWDSYKASSINFSKVSTVVIYQGKNLGDVLLSTPIVSVLRRYSVKRIIFVVKEGCTDIVGQLSGVDYVVRETRIGRIISSALRLRRERIDIFIDLHGSFDSSLTSRFIGARFSIQMANCRRRVFDRFHCITPSRRTSIRHRIEAHLDVMRRLGCSVESDDKKVLIEGWLGDSIGVCHRLHTLNPKYIVIHPGSRWLFKTPNPDFWLRLITRLTESSELSIVLTGANEGRERSLIEYLAFHTGAVISDTSNSLIDLACVLKNANGYIGVDTFSSHLANALALPGLVLFGPSDERSWGPHFEHAYLKVVVAKRFTCRPCNLDGCGGGKRSECLEALDPERVADQFIREYERRCRVS